MLRPRIVAGLSLLLVLAAGLVLAPAATADSQVRIVRLSLVEGPVQIDRALGDGFENAIMNMPITQGMTIATQDNGRAEVQFEDGSTLRLTPGTQVSFPQLGLRSSGARVTTAQVDQGVAYFNVRHKGDDEFRVAFSGREIDLDRNVRFRLDLTGANPELAVFKGELDVHAPSGEARVKKDQTLTFDAEDPDRYQLAKDIASEAWDSWDNDRVRYESQYSASSYAQSPYGYGQSDLNYYGSWVSWPGYGMVWRPAGVGYAWDPFYNGAWAWYPGFGYTWVSTYPWGWTPYRYGSWVFVSGYGWAWRPGAWRTWNAIPPVYNAPPNYHRPRPPAPGTVIVRGRPHNPTVVVERGVIHNPAFAPTGERIPPGAAGVKVERGIAPRVPLEGGGGVPAHAVAPHPGAPMAAPPSPKPAPRPDVRRREADHEPPVNKAPRVNVDRGTPPAHVERHAPAPKAQPSAPPSREQHGAPPPRVQRSAPPPAAHSAPPPRVQPSAPPVHMERKEPPAKFRR